MRARLGCLLLAGVCAAAAADREFDRVVKEIESHYGTRRMHMPLMGVANLVIKIGRPAGASSFKLAVFEDIGRSPDYGDTAELDRFMMKLGGGMQPLIRVRSQKDGEATYIFAGEAGKSTKMLIANFERREATVVQVSVDTETLMKMVATPRLAGHTFAHKKERWNDE